MRVLLALFLLSLLFTGNVTKADVWCVNDYDVVWKSKKGSCGWKNQKIPMPSNIDLTKGPTKIVDDMIFYSELKNETITNEKNNTKVSASNQTINNDELKEQLKYWKSLLEDELISQEDYNYKKNELLNFEINSSQNDINQKADTSFTNKIKIAILEPAPSSKCYKEKNPMPWTDIQNLGFELNDIFSKDDSFILLPQSAHPNTSIEGDSWSTLYDYKWEGMDNYLIVNTLTKKNCWETYYELLTVSQYFRTVDKHGEKKFPEKEMKYFENEPGHYSKKLAEKIYLDVKKKVRVKVKLKNWIACGMNSDIGGYFNNEMVGVCDPNRNVNNVVVVSNNKVQSSNVSSTNNNMVSELDNLMNNSNSQSINSNTNSSPNPCSYVRMGSSVCNKKYAEIKTWSDTRLCMNLEDVFFVETEELYLETARLRNIVCKNGRAYDSGTSSNIVNSFEPEDYETNCYKDPYSNKVTCKTKKIDNSTRELVGDILGELINQMR